MLIKNLTFTKTTAKIIVHVESIEDKKDIVAQSLLLGNFNPLREFSENDTPINLDKLKEFKDRYEDLICEMVDSMNVKVGAI